MMKELKFSIIIEASPQKVWDALWNQDSYSQWTSAFQQGSRYEGSLDEGSIVRMFDAGNNGMYNLVLVNKLFREMKFRHLGWLHNGAEDPQDWTDSTETYLLQTVNSTTELTVLVNALEEFVDFFISRMPEALKQIKILAEK